MKMFGNVFLLVWEVVVLVLFVGVVFVNGVEVGVVVKSGFGLSSMGFMSKNVMLINVKMI